MSRMSDELISRKGAIFALGERPISWTDSDYELGLQNQYDIDRARLEHVPAAQPERTGNWLEIPHTFMWQCSLCSWINDISSGFNYCPDCGAKMKEGD